MLPMKDTSFGFYRSCFLGQPKQVPQVAPTVLTSPKYFSAAKNHMTVVPTVTIKLETQIPA